MEHRHTVALFITLLVASLIPAQSPKPRIIHSAGNPILSDGSYYSTDPAPLVVGDTLYILAGRDEAPSNVNDFIMNEWQIFATKDVASHTWLHYPGILRPETVFAWSKPGHAYAGQIVQGPDKRFYLLTGQSVPIFIQAVGSFLISARILMSRFESLRSRLRALPFGRERRNISMTC